MTIVVAGILKSDGLILICRRRADQAHALKWEFPGGKVEPGESPAAALQRELREELGIDSEAASEITRYEFAYSGKARILLIFMLVDAWTGPVENRIFDAMEWVDSCRLADYDFLEGDISFIAGSFLSASGEMVVCEPPVPPGRKL